jgi:hypothetical protein
MPSDDTQIRISKALNSRVDRIRAETRDPKFTKEQLVAWLLSDCCEAIEAGAPSPALLTSILAIRRNLKKECVYPSFDVVGDHGSAADLKAAEQPASQTIPSGTSKYTTKKSS